MHIRRLIIIISMYASRKHACAYMHVLAVIHAFAMFHACVNETKSIALIS